jgi:hypothetical protein
MKGDTIDQPPDGSAPFGWDVWTHTEVVPKPDPHAITIHWAIGPVTMKPADFVASPATPATELQESEITLQLTADQMVGLSVSGTDKYGNPVDISGDAVWQSSDTSIILVKQDKSANPTSCYAIAAGPTGTASVTYTNDANNDGSGDFIGSIAIDVVAGTMAEIVITPGEPEAKDDSLPPVEGGGERPPNWSDPRPDHTLPTDPHVEPRGQQGRR